MRTFPPGLDKGSVSGYSPGALTPLTVGQSVDDLLDFAAKDEVRFGMGWSIDDQCGEVGVGELALVWARSSAGKSTMMLNIIANTPEVPTLVANMEMTPRRQVDWLVAMSHDLSVPARDIETVLRRQDDPRREELLEALSYMGDMYPHLHFVNPSRPTVPDLVVMLEDIEAATGTRPQRVFIDHLGLMKDTDDYSGYIKTASGLHSMAMQEEVALYVIQQTKRGGGEMGQNDGHLPVTFSSGVFGGEADADWVFGLFRPERDPKFRKSEHQFKRYDDYLQMKADREKVRGLVYLQCIKNRPYSTTWDDGMVLYYEPHSRRLIEE